MNLHDADAHLPAQCARDPCRTRSTISPLPEPVTHDEQAAAQLLGGAFGASLLLEDLHLLSVAQVALPTRSCSSTQRDGEPAPLLETSRQAEAQQVGSEVEWPHLNPGGQQGA
jgi:hypothetical protein